MVQQQVEITLKINLWMDAALHEEEIGLRIRNGIYNEFKPELMEIDAQKRLDILDIRQEAEIYGTQEG